MRIDCPEVWKRLESYGQRLDSCADSSHKLAACTSAEDETGSLLSRVAELRALPSNWNGPASASIGFYALRAAEAFAESVDRRLMDCVAPPPSAQVSPGVSGSVNIQWSEVVTDGKGLYISIFSSLRTPLKIEALRVSNLDDDGEEEILSSVDQLLDRFEWFLRG